MLPLRPHFVTFVNFVLELRVSLPFGLRPASSAPDFYQESSVETEEVGKRAASQGESP